MMERELIKLTREGYGKFNIYMDRVLVDSFTAEADTYHAFIPIRLWRTFNKLVEKRVKEMASQEGATFHTPRNLEKELKSE